MPDAGRWVVLDVESRGLDPQRDRLLAIAAIGVRPAPAPARIDLADSFEVVLRHDIAQPADKPNILVHGIGVAAQATGVEPAAALGAFEHYVDDAPLIGFHAAFDRVLLERSLKSALGHDLRGDWLDVEQLAAVTQPPPATRSLDDWLLHFGIECAVRHQAAADTLATAELLLALLPAAFREGARSFSSLARLAARHRWLRGERASVR